MSNSTPSRFGLSLVQARRAGAILLALCMIALIGCGGTKVYTADKTLLYRDNLYNMSNVQRIGGREDAILPNGEVVPLRGKEKKEIEALIDEHDEVMVSMVVEMDQQEMVYLRANVDRYSEYSQMKRRFERAMKDITKFMGDKKKTQLKLQ